MAVTDNFNRADGPLTSPWVQVEAGNVTIASNQVVGQTPPTDSIAYYPGFQNDHYAQVVCRDDATSSGPAVRITPDGDAYIFDIELHQIFSHIGTAYNSIASSGVPITIGDVVRLSAVGTLVRGYINDALTMSVVDADIPLGQPGIRAWNTAAPIDDWTGDSIGSSVVNVPTAFHGSGMGRW